MSSRPALVPPAHVTIAEAVRHALLEDLGRGDLTTDACVPPDVPGRAVMRAREELVISGLCVVEEVFARVGHHLGSDSNRVQVIHEASDGDLLQPGQVACVLQGPAATILRGERVALNFAQRMSGVATQAKRYVDRLPVGSACRVVDTRKTTPGLRAFERFAVRCGGAHNHREDLSSAVLIKDNHIAAAGSVTEAITRAKRFAPHTTRIECEVDTEEQLREALAAGADILLLDNFDDARVRAAVEFVAGRAILEASGGITLERIRSLAEAGVDAISVGALTHSYRSVDLGLDWDG